MTRSGRVLRFSSVFCAALLLVFASDGIGSANASSPPPQLQPEQPAIHVSNPESVFLLGITSAGHRLVGVGVHGVILTSDDSGKTWAQSPSPVDVSLNDVAFSTPQVGWAIGHKGVILRTTDGGASWTEVLDGHAAGELVLAHTLTLAPPKGADDTVYKRILKSAHATINEWDERPWLSVYLPPGKPDQALFMAAYGVSLWTHDGGKTWDSVGEDFDNPSGLHPYGVAVDGKAIYVAGEQGLIMKSVDQGATFKSLTSPYDGSFFGILATAPDHLVAYGLAGAAYVTADGGATWKASSTGTGAIFTDGQVLADKSVALSTEDGEIVDSTDHGATFHCLSIIDAAPAISSFVQVPDGDLIAATIVGIKRIPVTTGMSCTERTVTQ